MSGRVLFVTDDANTRRVFRQTLAPLQREWDVIVARGGADATRSLEGSPPDAMVADADLGGVGCAELLLEARRQHPQMARIVLVDPSQPGDLVRFVALAHRVVSKPYDPLELINAIQRSYSLRGLLGNSSLASVVGRLTSVPALSTLYTRIADELMTPDYSLAAVGDLVSQDLGIAAKMLQLANSALVGLRKQATTPNQAVKVLGADLTRTLVLAADLFSRYNPTSLRPFSIEALWTHSRAVAELASLIAVEERAADHVVREAALSGLLHDIGRLMLASQLSRPYKDVMNIIRSEPVSVIEAERRVLGTSHAEVGAYLLGLWGLPDALVEAVAWHHNPSGCPGTGFTPLTAVHAADVIVRAEEGAQPDAAYLARLGLSHRWGHWLDLRDCPKVMM